MKNLLSIKIIAYYSILLGISVVAMWIQILLNETIPEGKTAISFHLFSELLMALLCIISGFLQIRNKFRGHKANLVAHAMVVYSLINAMGYYAERDEISMVVLFILLALISFLILIYHFSIQENPSTPI